MASTGYYRIFSRRLLQSSTRTGTIEPLYYSRPVRLRCAYQGSCRYSSSAGVILREIGSQQEQQQQQEIAVTAPVKQVSPYHTAASMVVSRAPMLTRDLTEFEKAYFFYQKRLDKRLALPFDQDFYFREGTLAKEEWVRKQARLEKYEPKGYDAWKDELLIGEKPKEDEDMEFDELIKNTVTGEEITEHDTEEEIAAKKALDKPLPRISKADLEGDERSLNRKMSRTLYLLVQAQGMEGESWIFPQADIVGREHLGTTALRALFDSCGVNMNIWVVGNAPIGYHTQKFSDAYKKKSPNETMIGRKVFFMKSRILAGQVNIKSNTMGAKDFKWLAKEEIEKVVSKDYWDDVKNILVNR